MASETEMTHALLQSCSPESLISSLGLGIFCLVADRLLQFSIIQQNDWLRALSDNAVHCVIGMWSWAIVIGVKKKTDFGEVILAGFLASVIDVDHFLLAGSLSLKVRSIIILVRAREDVPYFKIRSSFTQLFQALGCFDSSTETVPSLFYCDTHCGSDPEVYCAFFQAQRLVVLSSLDVIYILDLTPCPRWNSSRLVDMPIWKNFSSAILALCDNHIIFTSHLFVRYVFNRDQTNDVFKTWNSY
ncbi:hypothetical protein HPG69_003372 [Diceros bicornis minor]|uniref:Transmembrane protein 267 n=1 Tax=Diceros bicornis minor TaxID=77932 RepID=A0A7J7E8N4_DICBM|nr:hypothetical protein HPG69_003372 [Diceros bicornis minor]